MSRRNKSRCRVCGKTVYFKAMVKHMRDHKNHNAQPSEPESE